MRLSKKDWKFIWSTLNQLCFIFIGTRLQCVQISLKITTGIIVFTSINLLTTEDLLTNTIIPLTNARIIIQRLEQVVFLSVWCPIQRLKDYIILFNIKPICANILVTEKSLVRKVSYALLCTMISNRGTFPHAKWCSSLIDLDFLLRTFNNGSVNTTYLLCQKWQMRKWRNLRNWEKRNLKKILLINNSYRKSKNNNLYNLNNPRQWIWKLNLSLLATRKIARVILLICKMFYLCSFRV